ncbi:MAG: RluA family pseudouridine synthase [Myxococcota bacterium]|nr:RluA family pseudouridine synthase [Myxococcota bacterium]
MSRRAPLPPALRPPLLLPESADLPLPIIYEDEALIAVVKPAELLSTPGRARGEGAGDSAQARLEARFGAPLHAVHRLDLATSGLLLFARNSEIARALGLAFQRRQVEKCYLAGISLTHEQDGFKEGAQGRISLPLRLEPALRPIQIVDFALGKHAESEWSALGKSPLAANFVTQVGHGDAEQDAERSAPQYQWIALRPISGRTHQLRLHLAHPLGLGHPIAGDRLYGVESAAPRLLLHALSLTLTHPISGELLTLKAPAAFAPALFSTEAFGWASTSTAESSDD